MTNKEKEVEQKTLDAIERTELNKGANGRLRKSGKIPAVIYGHMTATPVAIEEREFTTKFHTISENTIIRLNIGKKAQDVLVKDYQENHMTGKILHIDFYAIDQTKLLKSRVPIRLVGTAKGVRDGGILEVQLHDLDVECLPKDLPAEFVLDINELETNHAIHVKDIPLQTGVKFLIAGDQVVVSILHAKAEVVAPVAEAVEETAAAAEAVPAAGGTPAAQG